MSLTEQKMEKGNDDVDDEISYGVKRNRFKGLHSIYKMSLTKQKMEKRNDDVDDEISCGEKNRFKELPTIYKMSSTKPTMKKRNDDVEASANLLDSMEPDINVPIMKPPSLSLSYARSILYAKHLYPSPYFHYSIILSP